MTEGLEDQIRRHTDDMYGRTTPVEQLIPADMAEQLGFERPVETVPLSPPLSRKRPLGWLVGVATAVVLLLSIPAVLWLSDTEQDPDSRARPSVRQESFSGDPGWTGVNNTLNGNDFGFSETNLAGSDAGEVGGFFSSTEVETWYGDAAIGEIQANARIEASGILNIVSLDADYANSVFIGHFARDTYLHVDFSGIGFTILEQESEPDAIRIAYVIGGSEDEMFVLRGLGISRTWSYQYDPDVGQYGRLTLSITGPGGETFAHLLTEQERGSLVGIDTFGLTVESLSANTRIEVYVDDLAYTIR